MPVAAHADILLSRPPKVVRYLALGWIAAAGLSLAWNVFDEGRQVRERARLEAVASFEKDLLYRRWASGHGGVYVPPTAKTPPNPYLTVVPNRDVVTSSGQALTLINPAYMTRQVFELAEEKGGVQGHITSLNPLRPENAADPWEREALQAFARGVPEVSAVTTIDGAEFLRLMRPMITEASCLKCHEQQGYKVGEIRGGISVSVPLASYMRGMRSHLASTAATHALFCGLGLAGFWIGRRQLHTAWRARTTAEHARRLSDQRWQAALDSAGDGLWDWNVETGEVFYSARWLAMLGYAEGELRPHDDEWRSRVHPDDLAPTMAALQRHLAGETPSYESEHRLRSKDGAYKWVLDRGRVTERTPEGRPRRMIGTHTDITLRRQSEARVRKQEEEARLLHELYAAAPTLTEAQLYDQVIETAVGLTDSAIGFLHRVADDQNTILLTTWNKEARAQCTAGFETHYPIQQAGNWVDCVREGRPVIYNDFARSPHQKGLPAGHSPVRRFMSMPVLEGGKVRIIFGVGNKVADYTDEDLGRLQRVADELQKILGRMYADRALAESETRYRRLVEMSPEAIIVHSEGRIVFGNPAAAALVGAASASDIYGRSILDFVHPEDRDLVRARAQRMVTAGVSVPMQEERFLRLDGSVVEVEVFAVGLHYAGRPAVQVMARDISVRKAADAALRAAENRFHSVWQQSNDGMRLTDAEGRLLAVNEAYCRLVDLPRESLEGQFITAAYEANAADPADAVLARYRERFARRSIPPRIERRMTFRSGRVADLEVASTFLDLGGGQVALLGLFRDVTAQKRAEAALREGEEKFSKAFQYSPAMMALSRLEDGTYLEVNETFVRKTGYSHDEALGRTSVELGLLRPEDRARILEIVREHSVVRDFEVTLRTKHGHMLHGVFGAQMITIGGRRCLLSTVADITARKEAEAAREALARALENKNRELANLVYATSHDLRSPLLNIQGFSARVETSCAELVRLTALAAPAPADRAAATAIATEQLPKALGYVQAGVAKMDQLINGLLRLSRLDRAGLRPEPVAMEALCSETLAAMAFSLQQAGATVEIGSLPACTGDTGLIGQLFSNLIDNAVKYRDRARPLVIRVTGRVVGERVEYCVADNGLGISAAHLPRIWDVFFRANPRDAAGGEGLGLNLVRRIAERHHGEVWVESTLGEGSRFFVALPAAAAPTAVKEKT